MKAKLLKITADLLVEMCKPKPGVGWQLLREGLPLDAKVDCVLLDRRDPNGFAIMVTSESWPEFVPGHALEEVTPPVFQSTEHGIPSRRAS